MLNRQQRQEIQKNVDNYFSKRSWYAGSGYADPMNPDKLVIAYNFYPTFDLVNFKSDMTKFGVEYELRDIRVLKPGSYPGEVPSHIKQY